MSQEIILKSVRDRMQILLACKNYKTGLASIENIVTRKINEQLFRGLIQMSNAAQIDKAQDVS